MKSSKLWFFTILVLSSVASSAETLICKSGPISKASSTTIEITVDMDKGKSFLRWVPADGMGVLQGLSLTRRRYQANDVRYTDTGSTNVFLEVPVTNNPKISGSFTHEPQQLSGIPVNCDLYGSIPAGPKCPKAKDSALLKAMDTAETLDEVEFLLQCGANPNVTNSKGCTPLMLAVDPLCHPGLASGMINDWVGLADLFLNNGAFVDLKDKKGETALIKSVRNEVDGIVDVFIAAEADFNIRDAKGNTALMYSAITGNKLIIQDILLGNPDRRLKNRAGQTAYDLAKYWHDQETADLVKVPDATVTITGQSDGTCSPLSVDVKAGQTIELALVANNQMFMLNSSALSLDLMADSGSTVKKTITFTNRGDYSFTCGPHGGGGTPSKGTISVK